MKPAELNYRQWTVLALLDEGRTHAEVARTFNVTPTRIKEVERESRAALAYIAPHEWPAVLANSKRP